MTHSRSERNRTGIRGGLFRLLQAAALLGVLVSGGVCAQETVRKWHLDQKGDGTSSAAFSSESEVQQYIVKYGHYSSYPWEVVSQSVVGNKVLYLYQVKPAEPITSEWVYTSDELPRGAGDGSLIPYPTEAALIEALEEKWSNWGGANGECPRATVTVGDWFSEDEWYWDNGENTQKKAPRKVVYYRSIGSSDCVEYTSQSPVYTDKPLSYVNYITRSRTIHCPRYSDSGISTVWRDDLNACSNHPNQKIWYFADTLPTSQCQVGNPCDPTTGNKIEPVVDIDLGWVRFARTYNSMSSSVSGFGGGWTHSHNARLTLSTNASGVLTVGLTGNDGAYVVFKAQGDGYTASDSSGDRIVQQGEQWRLLRADQELLFDATGRLQQQSHPDGSTLTYAYDAADRLLSLTHNGGRRLEFDYASALVGAPIQAIRLGETVLAAYTYAQTNTGEQLETVTYADGRTHRYHYEDPRYPMFLTGVTREDGQRYSTFAYDDKGRVISSQHAGGADGVTLSYPATGGSIVTDALGHATTYGVTPPNGNEQRLLTTITDSTGTVTWKYNYAVSDFRRRVKSVVDHGVETLHAYTETTEGGVPVRVHTITEAVGTPQRRVRKERHEIASNRLVGVTVGTQDTRITRNDRGQPTQVTVTDTAGSAARTTAYTYCDTVDGNCPWAGLLLSVDGPRTDVSDVVRYAYYPSDDAGCAATPASCPHRQGDLRSVTNALGQVTEILTYDNAGRPVSVKDPNGVITDTVYDPRGRPTAINTHGGTQSQDRLTQIDYWPTGLVKQVILPDGAITTYTYDAAQRLTGIADAAGNTLRFTLDLAGNKVKEDITDASGTLTRTLSRVYNTLGQLATQADAQANPTDFTYDANGNTDTITDALGRVTDHDYDPLKRLARTLQDVDGIAAETTFQYDALDNLTKVTDPKGLSTTYTYNGLSDLTQLQSPDTGTTTYTYDSAGNRKTQTDARGVTTQYDYDALNRLTNIAYPDATLNVAYTYDIVPAACETNESFALGRLSAMADSSGSTQYCYDRFGNTVRKVQTTNGVTFVLRYAYTLAGQLQAMVYPDGTTVDYARDAQGRITEVGVARTGNPREVLLHQARYYPFGPVASWSYGNGRQMTRSLDQDYRPLAVQDSGTGGLSLNFGFDPVGNLTELSSGSPPPLNFVYDPLGRLTETRDGPTQVAIDTYSYDKTGNRTAYTTATGTSRYGYPTNSHRLTDVGGVIRAYDAAGNTLKIGAAKEFVYNDANRMSQVKQAGVVAMDYAYNGKGEQVRKHLGTSNTYTLYDESGHWLGDYDSTGVPLQQALWMDDLPVGLIANGNQLHYIQPDHLGTPRVVIEATRDVPVWMWDVKGEAFGNTLPDQNPDGDANMFVLDMRFPGQRYDAVSGLNQNGFRDYEAATGRYPQSDPIGLMGGINSYAYGAGQPTMMIDPLGLQSSMAGAGSSQASSAAAGAYNPYNPNNPNNVSPAVPSTGSSSRPQINIPEVSADGLLESLAKMSPLGMLSDLEKAIGNKLNNVCDDGDELEQRCEENLRRDLATCRALGKRGTSSSYKICESQAMLRYGNCLSGRDEGINAPLPPWGR